jgi:hypothetical protein
LRDFDLHGNHVDGVLVSREASLDSQNQSGLSGGRSSYANQQWLQRENNKHGNQENSKKKKNTHDILT